jgi:hypothetical protein
VASLSSLSHSADKPTIYSVLASLARKTLARAESTVSLSDTVQFRRGVSPPPPIPIPPAMPILPTTTALQLVSASTRSAFRTPARKGKSLNVGLIGILA